MVGPRLAVFVVILLVGNSAADKEFWWMGQDGTFGNQVPASQLSIYNQTDNDEDKDNGIFGRGIN